MTEQTPVQALSCVQCKLFSNDSATRAKISLATLWSAVQAICMATIAFISLLLKTDLSTFRFYKAFVRVSVCSIFWCIHSFLSSVSLMFWSVAHVPVVVWQSLTSVWVERDDGSSLQVIHHRPTLGSLFDGHRAGLDRAIWWPRDILK